LSGLKWSLIWHKGTKYREFKRSIPTKKPPLMVESSGYELNP